MKDQEKRIKDGFSDEELLKSIQYSRSHKDVQAQLRESESLMSRIFEDVSVIIILLDENLNVLKINKAGLRLSGYAIENVIGKSLGYSLGCQYAYVGKEECGDLIACQGCGLIKAVKKANMQKTSFPGLAVQLAVNQRSNLELRQFTASASYISTWKKPTVLLTLNDISNLRKYQDELVEAKEKAEESNMLKTAFLANMSHEIRTPLNAINGFAYLLHEDDQASETQKSYVSHITKGVDQLLNIVNNVVEMSKIQAGQLTANRVECYPKAIFLEVYNSFLGQIENRQLDLKLEMDISANFQVKTDSEKLKQILTNILSNAVKFTHSGEVLVKIKQSGDQVEIRVKDTGIGIPADQIPHIFKGFYQVDNGLNKLYGGNGLGLTIAKQYVELLGGQIDVHSMLDVGTEFIVTFSSK